MALSMGSWGYNPYKWPHKLVTHWGYHPYKWPQIKWVTGVIALLLVVGP